MSASRPVFSTAQASVPAIPRALPGLRMRATLFAVALATSHAATAAIPLLGPCDPDFRNSGSCSPGSAKSEKPAVPAKPPKSGATSQPAPASGPSKSAPAAKTPLDARPDVAQVSQHADENCPKSRADHAEDTLSTLVTLSVPIGP